MDPAILNPHNRLWFRTIRVHEQLLRMKGVHSSCAIELIIKPAVVVMPGGKWFLKFAQTQLSNKPNLSSNYPRTSIQERY